MAGFEAIAGGKKGAQSFLDKACSMGRFVVCDSNRVVLFIIRKPHTRPWLEHLAGNPGISLLRSGIQPLYTQNRLSIQEL
jgi:hypothetical protein